MSVLSDVDLLERGPYIVDPFDRSNVQPASIDLRLHDVFLIPNNDAPIDLGDIRHDSNDYKRYDANQYMLMPGRFILGSTLEYIAVPDDLVANVEGKSSLGRLGLVVHVTAGYVDPGFRGRLTLEMVNLSQRPIIVRAGLLICQLALAQLRNPAQRPYGSEGLDSHYQNQLETTASRYDGVL